MSWVSEAVETTHYGERQKIRVQIFYDECGDIECPLEGQEGSGGIEILIWERNSVLPRYNPLSDHSGEELTDALEERYPPDEWHVFRVRAYKHGMVSYTVAHAHSHPFTCRWDSGWAGLALVPKKLYETREIALERTESYLRTITDWCNGYVFGYVIEAKEVWTSDSGGYREEYSEHLDSCWGFIGLDWCREAAYEALSPYLDDLELEEREPC